LLCTTKRVGAVANPFFLKNFINSFPSPDQNTEFRFRTDQFLNPSVPEDGYLH